MGSVKHYHHHYHFSYTTSLKRHFTSVMVVIAILLTILLLTLHSIAPTKLNLNQVSLVTIATATLNTLMRLAISYAVAMIISIPLALLITSTPKIEKVLLPIFDILQSIPVLAFFPVIVITFVQANFLEGAAIFIIVIAMMGSLVFSMIGGIKTIPYDINASAQVFGATGWKKLLYVTLPSIFPTIITGSLLAWSQAWSIIIVAEALHTYIPHGTPQSDLYGLGSVLVNSFSQGKTGVFLASLTSMIIVISLLNYFVWQKLLRSTERFRFD